MGNIIKQDVFPQHFVCSEGKLLWRSEIHTPEALAVLKCETCW